MVFKRCDVVKKIVKIIQIFGSYEGEDKMMLHLLPKKGKYLDIGCNTPIKGSNTLLLYMKGWDGICIDIRKIRRFKWLRPRDKVLVKEVIDISEYKDYDLLDLDVDGIEIHILKTMTFYPEFILVECHLPMQNEIPSYLESLGYEMIGMTKMNKFFRRGV